MKNPMPLKNLPSYLKNLKEKDETDEYLVVDMGQVTPTNNSGKKIILLAIVVFFLTMGAFTYDFVTTKNITIVLNSKLDPVDISKILEDNGGNVTSVKQKKDYVYEVKLSLRKNTNLFIEKLRKNKLLDNVEINIK